MEPPKDYAVEAQEPDDSTCLPCFFAAMAWGVCLGWLLHWMWVALAG